MVTDNGRAMVVAPAADLTQIEKLADLCSQSNFFKDATSKARAGVKILAGQEIGVGPIAALQGIIIINDKVSYTANLMATLVKRSPRYDYRIRKLDNNGCDLEFFQTTDARGSGGWESIGHSTFGLEDAKTAGLSGGNYTKFPRNMFFARAMSNGAKWYCPDIFGGVTPYTPEELGAKVDAETGEVLEVPAEAMPPQPEPDGTIPLPATAANWPPDSLRLYRDWYERIQGCKTLAELAKEGNLLHGCKAMTPSEVYDELAAFGVRRKEQLSKEEVKAG